MSLRTYSLRELGRRPVRSLLTVVGIAVGVATVVASTTAMQAARLGCADLFDDLSGPRSLVVTAASNAGFDGRIRTELEAIPGIRACLPRVRSAAALLGPSGPVPTVVVGEDLDSPQATEHFRLLDGRGLRAEGEILLDAALAEANHLQPADRVCVICPAGSVELLMVGRLSCTMRAVAHHIQAVVSLATAQHLFGLENQVNEIQCLLTEQADMTRIAAEVRRRMPVGLTVQTPGGQCDPAEATRAGVEQGLAGLSGIALVAAGFVVFNTFLMNLGEQEQDVALLRSLGATMRQVRRMLLGQAAVLGAAGAVLGCGVGTGLGLVLLYLLGAFLGVELPTELPGPDTWFLGLAIGIGTAVAAVSVPVRNAAARPILESWQQQRSRRAERLPCGLAVLGLFLLMAAGLGIAACVANRVAPWVGSRLFPLAVATLLTAGVLIAAPFFPRLLVLGGLVPRKFVPVEADLALRQLQRRPLRTPRTAGVLVIVLVMAVGFGNVLSSTFDELQEWCQQSIPADFLVQSSLPDTAFLLATAIPEKLAGEIQAMPGVTRVAKIRFVPAHANDKPALVLARTFERSEPLPLDLIDGSSKAVHDGLLRGEVVVGSGLAHGLGVHIGERLRLDTCNGPQQVGIVGTAMEFAGGGQSLYVEWNAAKSLLHFAGAHVLLVTAEPGQLDQVGSRLRTFCAEQGLLLQTHHQLHRQIDQLFGRVTATFWALIALAFLIASLRPPSGGADIRKESLS